MILTLDHYQRMIALQHLREFKLLFSRLSSRTIQFNIHKRILAYNPFRILTQEITISHLTYNQNTGDLIRAESMSGGKFEAIQDNKENPQQTESPNSGTSIQMPAEILSRKGENQLIEEYKNIPDECKVLIQLNPIGYCFLDTLLSLNKATMEPRHLKAVAERDLQNEISPMKTKRSELLCLQLELAELLEDRQRCKLDIKIAQANNMGDEEAKLIEIKKEITKEYTLKKQIEVDKKKKFNEEFNMFDVVSKKYGSYTYILQDCQCLIIFTSITFQQRRNFVEIL
ncbi:hypothetical protein FGO68_gene16040 [Halteria grandinella]|uniref:Uncharacterized protein n=1 Tax=Halteria grandinella TaxID=5974 RepID=A0A8J8SUA0_HALGN|nr:hypothetical protein FGO68_gene16040 [Halteria grandinella]